MREIKFRAWDSKNDVMRDWDYIRTSWTLNILSGDRNTEIMQFTSLHDKNGKEIYEGDVVEIEDGPTKKKREVVFSKSEAAFSLRLGNGSTEYLPNYVRYGQIEVIGNIYEHPELLK